MWNGHLQKNHTISSTHYLNYWYIQVVGINILGIKWSSDSVQNSDGTCTKFLTKDLRLAPVIIQWKTGHFLVVLITWCTDLLTWKRYICTWYLARQYTRACSIMDSSYWFMYWKRFLDIRLRRFYFI
jgi:hypothetical protein